ncbi:penicillin-binding protein 1C [Psychromonas sp.]|uniref:penicillin-binding protein 1C n=1 Tax=Psychromonas sp. TaxID=1884585 RepID=UPI0039E5EACC
MKLIKGTGGLLITIMCLFFIFNITFPLPDLNAKKGSTVILDKQGEILRSFADSQGIHRFTVASEEISPLYIETLITYEDRFFYHHFGFNPISYLRAAWQWLVNGKVISGGSTLTMQVARLVDPHQRSLFGKLKQLFRALQLELTYSKKEILSLYLNFAPFGSNIEGVEAAARLYLNKSSKELNLAEAALLVVLPQRPTAYRPDRNNALAQAMRNKVLKRLVLRGKLNEQAYLHYSSYPIPTERYNQAVFTPLLSRALKQKNPSQHVIQTYIDSRLQRKIKTTLLRLKSQLPAKVSSAVMVVRNSDHTVIAYQGSIDFTDNARFAYVDMADAIRSPGSTLKPFIYGMALDQGLIHSESLLSDIPSVFSGYKPKNLNGRYAGNISLKDALHRSLNIPLIQVFNALTPQFFTKKMAQSGVSLTQANNIKANLSIGLGGTGISLVDLVTLYSALANDGQIHSLRFKQNEKIQLRPALLSSAANWIIFDLLQSNPPPDRSVAKFRRKIAWKTGTSYGYRDTWAIGVSPDYSVGVWIGRPDGAPSVGQLGASTAAPLMFDLFDLLDNDQQQIEKPLQVVDKTICWPGGISVSLTPAPLCETRKLTALTINGLTPATLESDGTFVLNHQRPHALSNWLKRFNRDDLLPEGMQQEPVNNSTPLKILRPHHQQHFFTEQVDMIDLKVNHPEQVNWYINGQLYQHKQLQLSAYNSPIKITACRLTQCERIEIYAH